MSRIPVVLFGKTEAIGAGVIKSLSPNYNVVTFILSVEAAIAELPSVLKGQNPATKSSSLGSADYSQGSPKALIFGGGYSDAAIDDIFKGIGGTPTVSQLRLDSTVPMPPVGPAYGKKIVERCLNKLDELAAEGKLNNDREGLFFY